MTHEHCQTSGCHRTAEYRCILAQNRHATSNLLWCAPCVWNVADILFNRYDSDNVLLVEWLWP